MHFIPAMKNDSRKRRPGRRRRRRPMAMTVVMAALLSPRQATVCHCLVPAQHPSSGLDSTVVTPPAAAVDRRGWLSRCTIGAFAFFGSNANAAAAAVASPQTFTKQQSTLPWTATNLSLFSIDHAVAVATEQDPYSTWPMGRWPDPILRRPADPVQEQWFQTATLRQAASLLKRTADQNGAVGLAAQQCGVNARMVYLSPETIKTSKNNSNKRQNTNQSPQPSQVEGGLVLVNPYIIDRSPEASMRVWVEECLVLPPSFRATVLRDDWIDVHYRDVDGSIHQERFYGEASRCLQHEMDHDRGILITDHVGLEELTLRVAESIDGLNMRQEEAAGHEQRMEVAYNRYIDTPTIATTVTAKIEKNVLATLTGVAFATHFAFSPIVSSSSRMLALSQDDDNESIPPTMEELQGQLSYIEALEERNKAQLDSFIDEQDQWDSLEPFEQVLLARKSSIFAEIDRLKDATE